MPRETKEPVAPNVAPAEPDSKLVAVMFASNAKDAERSCALLRENGIAASIQSQDETAGVKGGGVPVLVPIDLLEEASEILATRDDESSIWDADPAVNDADADEDLDDDADEMDDDDDDDDDDDADDDVWDDDDDEETVDDDEDE